MVGVSRLIGGSFLGVVVVLILTLVGCGDDATPSQDLERRPAATEQSSGVRVEAEVVQLSERDCEVIHFVLSTEKISNGGKPLFLTPTAREQWNQQGDWVSMPAPLKPWLAKLPVEFRAAADAKLDKGYVRDKATGARGMMVWVVIKEWASPDEVTLDFGLWGGPLDASGKTITCLKKDGQWQIKEETNIWLS